MQSAPHRQFSFFPLLNAIIFFTQICNCVTSTSIDFFCFGFTSSSSSFRCLSCVPLRFSTASVSHFRCFCVVSFLLIVFYGVLSCSCGYFFQSLFQPTQMTFNSTCLLFFFHLCFKFLAQQYVSFSNSKLTDFESKSKCSVSKLVN